MNKEVIEKTEQFLKDTFRNSPYLRAHPKEGRYRLEHSYRGANIGREIAEAEGFDVTQMVIACLLHDISYCQELSSPQLRKDHGRMAATLAKSFLKELGLPEEDICDILYGIAIHVDDAAGFSWRRTAFAETVGDADNIDRFDAYRIYETLEHSRFSELPLEEKKQRVMSTLEKLDRLRDMKLATKTAAKLWQQRLDFYISFYNGLQRQLENSDGV